MSFGPDKSWGIWAGSCDGGNLEPVVVRTVGDVLPRVALFAKRDIAEAEELCFGYGPPNAGPSPDESPMSSCGAGCSGRNTLQILPHVSSPSGSASRLQGLAVTGLDPRASLVEEDQGVELASLKTAHAWESSTKGLLARHDIKQLPESKAELAACEERSVPPGSGANFKSPKDSRGPLVRLPRPCLCGTEACLGYLPCSL